jgi:sulfide dehydrogenase cytochrome subunit
MFANTLIREAQWLFGSAVLLSIWFPANAIGDESGTHVRTLASSCATCHGDNPKHYAVIPGLAGLDRVYFINKMSEYRNSEKKNEVMVQHAKGLTDVEIEQLATYFAHQARACPARRNSEIQGVEK